MGKNKTKNSTQLAQPTEDSHQLTPAVAKEAKAPVKGEKKQSMQVEPKESRGRSTHIRQKKL